mgnify:CR=1 FL=1
MVDKVKTKKKLVLRKPETHIMPDGTVMEGKTHKEVAKPKRKLVLKPQPKTKPVLSETMKKKILAMGKKAVKERKKMGGKVEKVATAQLKKEGRLGKMNKPQKLAALDEPNYVVVGTEQQKKRGRANVNKGILNDRLKEAKKAFAKFMPDYKVTGIYSERTNQGAMEDGLKLKRTYDGKEVDMIINRRDWDTFMNKGGKDDWEQAKIFKKMFDREFDMPGPNTTQLMFKEMDKRGKPKK